MVKTLIAELDRRLIVAVVPVGAQLDLRALAATMGAKKCRMAAVADAERAAGYATGRVGRVPPPITLSSRWCTTVGGDSTILLFRIDRVVGLV